MEEEEEVEEIGRPMACYSSAVLDTCDLQEDVTSLLEQSTFPSAAAAAYNQRRCDHSSLPQTYTLPIHVQSSSANALLLPLSSTSPSPSSSPSPPKTSTSLYLLCVVALFALALIESTTALHITSHSIPASVDGSNRSQAVTLDCRYAFDGSDLKLVVRWFHNDSPEPIYQWIPEPDVRYIGELIRPYFDVDYQVPGGDRFSKYRALRLLGRLPVTLSGNYTCVISSIAATVDHRGLMVVYVPPATFDFRFIELNSGEGSGPRDAIALECTVTGVYPRPVLVFTETTSSNASYRHRAPPVNVTVLATTTTTPEIDSDNDDDDVNEAEKNQEPRRRFPSSPRYSASFRYPVQSVLSAGTVYECRLALPGTSYARKKRIKIIFPTTYSAKIPGGGGGYYDKTSSSMSSFSGGAGLLLQRRQDQNFWTLLLLLLVTSFISCCCCL